jgi:molybdate transport system substrate-binding protein
VLGHLLAASIVLSVPIAQGASSITVSAATSLTEVLEEIARAYAAAGGGTVRFNHAGSNALARQIVNGAPADVFISADEAQMDAVERSGAVVAGSRMNLVRNQLAVIAAPNRIAVVREQFLNAGPGIRRLALGDPAAVPAGVYARRYLEQQGSWKAYESRIIPTANVRAALVAVATGLADAAIVYATDAAIARNASVAMLVPLNEGPDIVYPAALLSRSRNAGEARRFLAFLRGSEASAIFARHRFLPLNDR